jgi:hypothetical protein
MTEFLHAHSVSDQESCSPLTLTPQSSPSRKQLASSPVKFNASNYSNPSVYELHSFSKTARKVKTRKTKFNFPLLPDGNNDRFAR